MPSHLICGDLHVVFRPTPIQRRNNLSRTRCFTTSDLHRGRVPGASDFLSPVTGNEYSYRCGCRQTAGSGWETSSKISTSGGQSRLKAESLFRSLPICLNDA